MPDMDVLPLHADPGCAGMENLFYDPISPASEQGRVLVCGQEWI